MHARRLRPVCAHRGGSRPARIVETLWGIEKTVTVDGPTSRPIHTLGLRAMLLTLRFREVHVPRDVVGVCLTMPGE